MLPGAVLQPRRPGRRVAGARPARAAQWRKECQMHIPTPGAARSRRRAARRRAAAIAGALTVLLAVPAAAAAWPASGAAPSASAAQVPSLLRAQVAQLRGALGGAPDGALAPQAAARIAGRFLPLRGDGRLDVELHLLGGVEAADTNALARLGVQV